MARFDLMAVLAKAETTYGTDPTPTAAANALLLQEVEWTPMEHDEVARPRVLPWYGNDAVVAMARRVRMRGAVDLAGGGAAGVVPAWGPLLRACQMNEAIVADTSVHYTPLSNGLGSVTLYHYMDDVVHKTVGVRGDWGIELVARQVPKLTFDMMGMFLEHHYALVPTPTLTPWYSAAPVGFAETPTATLDGHAVRLARFTYRHGHRLSFRDMPNARQVIHSGFESTAEIEIELPDIQVKDFLGQVGSNRGVVITHGTVAGNIVTVNLYNSTVLRPRYSNVDGMAHLTLGLRPMPNAGNDQIQITIT